MGNSVWFVWFGFLALVLLPADAKPKDLYEGSRCHNPDATPGNCLPITNCTSALAAIRESGHHGYRRCGFDRFVEIVCCPGELRHVVATPKPGGGGDDDPTHVRNPDFARKSQKACERYSKNLPIVLSYHIVGGENAEKKEFPHMAALGFYSEQDEEYRFDCGGTLVSERYIVTAAHCIINVQQAQLKIARLGVVNVPEAVRQPDPQIDHDVANVTVHKDYNWKEKFNDIALVKLERKVVFTDEVRPACLYAKGDDPQVLMVTGWGAVGLGAERSSRLQKATLTPVPLGECNATYQARTSRVVTARQICAADNVSDACQGDSGGPLQTQSASSILTIVGVTSYGIGCGSKYPGIYTRISSYLDWIEEIVWP